MTPTFTYDPSTNLGEVRLLAGDTDISVTGEYQARSSWSCMFSDEEIQKFIAATATKEEAAARAFRTVAANRLLLVKYASISLSGESYSLGDLTSRLIELADALDKKAKADSSDVSFLTGRVTSTIFDYEIPQ